MSEAIRLSHVALVGTRWCGLWQSTKLTAVRKVHHGQFGMCTVEQVSVNLYFSLQVYICCCLRSKLMFNFNTVPNT
jgi:hypothetical protein